MEIDIVEVEFDLLVQQKVVVVSLCYSPLEKLIFFTFLLFPNLRFHVKWTTWAELFLEAAVGK